ncbi:Prolyl endopeptidase [Labilithrix luteola]|uniref:prolyl oligopeptidase n=1 Tax=Labilithrix luteola TaxID=1391654 RepID=A0A0K1QBX7_9BACT|nr:prolyl oligopeptidase family serine peptidase [Labilithrix luteola]AKV03244.1 Prolyl endopeptidase [Labilithrix luteola]
MRRMRSASGVFCALSVLTLTLGACKEAPKPNVPPLTVALVPTPSASTKYPPPMTPTRKQDLVETIHGESVSDPYRWLEDSDSPEVHAWTEAQNAHTRAVIDTIAGRADLEREVKDLLQIGYVTAPAIRTTHAGAKRYFHTKREGAQNQPTVYVRDGLTGKDRVLLDASALSADGTTAVDWWFPSMDGQLVAWGRSESGSEESTLFVRDVGTGKDLPDHIDRTRHASVAWMPDGKSFYYTRFPEPGSVPPGDEKYFSKIFHHVLGQDSKGDKLVFGEGRAKTDSPSVSISPNGRWLVARVHMGWDKSEVFVKDLSKGDGAPWVAIAENKSAIFEPIPRNDRLYVLTNDGAPHYKLYAVEYDKPARSAWKEILPEGSDVLDDVAILKNEIVASYMHDAATRLERFGLDGKSRGPVELPSIGSASATGAWDGEEAFVTFTSYVVPYEVLRLDLRGSKEAKLEPWDKVGAQFSAQGIEVQRLYATSKDGTKVPMFVIAKKGLVKNGENPTVLYGYGGFNVNQTPAFSARALASVQRGAVWVTAILRGGGELGEDWHQAGMREKKQNVFDDFYACAEALVKEKITNSSKLGIVGGSNGGLLVATAVTQRPELFRVGLSLVPLTDMVRYPHFRIAKLWIPEYGDPDKSEDFRFLYAYSPYHHVQEDVQYPSMLFTTAESDSRVDPMHARKMAARMQEVQKDPTRPILIRIETKAGHGAGKPVTKLADELADELSFLLHELGAM